MMVHKSEPQILVLLSCVILLTFLSLSYANECPMVKVASCPATLEQWKTRELEIKCSIPSYACILTENGTLVETCMHDYRIHNYGGCPFIKKCGESGPEIALPIYFSRCNPDITGCPPNYHSGYTLSQLHKYPACFIPEEKRTRDWMTIYRTSQPADKTTQSVTVANTGIPNEEWNGGTNVLLTVLIVLIIMLIAVVIVFGGALVCYIKSRRAENFSATEGKWGRNPIKAFSSNGNPQKESAKVAEEADPLPVTGHEYVLCVEKQSSVMSDWDLSM